MSLEHSPELDKLATALAKAQAAIEGAAKDSTNPHFHSKYASLASVWDAVRKPYTDNGLSVVQSPGYDNGVATMTTLLLHTSGQWIKGTAGARLSKDDPQGVGSADTYLRRQSLAAFGSVAPEDDDGEAATQHTERPARPERGATEDGEIKLPGKPEQWDGFGGRPLSQVPAEVLTKAAVWLEKKDATKNRLLVEAIKEELDRKRQ